MSTDLLILIATLYAKTFPADLLRYVIGAGGVWLVINVVLKNWIAHRRIRQRQASWLQIRREWLYSFRTVLIFTATGTLIALGYQYGLVRIYTDITMHGIGWLLLSALILVLAHDTWFYWTHRLMHDPRLFTHCHAGHHKSVIPTPFTAYAFDSMEALVNAVFLPLILLVLPAHPAALLFFVSHMMLRNAIAHCGFEIFPATRHGKPLFDWLTAVTHHDLHHANGRYNFGFYFTFWDRWMGTEHPDYYRHFARASGKEISQVARVTGKNISPARKRPASSP